MFHLLGLGFGLWALFFVFRDVFALVVVAVVVWLLLRQAGQGRGPLGPPRSSGLEILEQRYARGEIARDEYLEKKRDLLAGHSP